MNEIEQLLEDLNAMVPVSAEFKTGVRDIMQTQDLKNRSVLQKLNKLAIKAWQVIEGCLLAIAVNDKAEESVVKIYVPRMIATDLHSFFKLHPTRFKIVAIGDTKVLELKKKDFNALYKYPETDKLIQFIMLLEEEKEARKTEMLKLPPPERVKMFLALYPVPALPDKYSASFLGLSVDEYIEQKVFLQREPDDASRFSKENIKEMNFANAKNMVHKVREYILFNFTNPNLGNTDEIAHMFNTTKKTLTREFQVSFHTTVHNLIIRLRMEKALYLLKEAQMDVGEVAMAVGYSSVFSFSRAFKQYYGYTAREFNKS